MFNTVINQTKLSEKLSITTQTISSIRDDELLRRKNKLLKQLSQNIQWLFEKCYIQFSPHIYDLITAMRMIYTRTGNLSMLYLTSSRR